MFCLYYAVELRDYKGNSLTPFFILFAILMIAYLKETSFGFLFIFTTHRSISSRYIIILKLHGFSFLCHERDENI
jgi:hypothetical protein